MGGDITTDMWHGQRQRYIVAANNRNVPNSGPPGVVPIAGRLLHLCRTDADSERARARRDYGHTLQHPAQCDGAELTTSADTTETDRLAH